MNNTLYEIYVPVDDIPYISITQIAPIVYVVRAGARKERYFNKELAKKRLLEYISAYKLIHKHDEKINEWLKICAENVRRL